MTTFATTEISTKGEILFIARNLDFIVDNIQMDIGDNLYDLLPENQKNKLDYFLRSTFGKKDYSQSLMMIGRYNISITGFGHPNGNAMLQWRILNAIDETPVALRNDWGYSELPAEQKTNAATKLAKADDATLRRFTDNLPLVVFEITLYADGRFRFGFVSNEVYSFFPGFNREAINADNSLLFVRVHPEDKEKLMQSIKNVFLFNVWDIEYRIIENGQVRWVQGYGRPEKGSDAGKDCITVCTYLRDITDKKNNALRLELIEFSFRKANIPIAYIRQDGSIYDYNQAYLDTFDHTEEEIRHLRVYDTNPEFDEAIWAAYWEELRAKKSITILSKRIKKDGSILRILANANMIRFGDQELNCAMITDVTNEKKLEDELRLVNFAFESSIVPIFFAREDGSLHAFNQAAMEQSGYERLEMAKLKAWDINTDCSEESWKQVWGHIKAAKEATYIGRHQKKDGTMINVEVKANFVAYNDVELICSFINDITEKIKWETALEESLARFTNATLATSDVVWEVDLEKNLYYMTPNFTTVFGHPSGVYEPLQDNEWTRNLHPEDFPKSVNFSYRHIMNRSDNWTSEYRLKKKNGEYAIIEDKIVSIKNAQGEIVRLVGAMRDVTQMKLAEKEKNALMEELVDKNRDLTQFSFIATHNLRAPLTNLVSICNLLKPEHIDDPLTQKLLEAFVVSTHSLHETLDDLIKVLVIKMNRKETVEEIEFQPYLQKTIATMKNLIDETQIEIKADFSHAETVLFSPVYMESLFGNLLSNSIKYARKDFRPVVNITTNKDAAGNTELIFSDNGIGIDMSRAKDKIFGLYQRFHEVEYKNSKGIGLYLVHSQVTALGGKIRVDSEPNKGTRFTITFKS